VLLRVLGLQALAALVGTMPARTARVLTMVMLVGANLFPLVALLQGVWQAGDVLLTYWLENVAVGLWQLVKLFTAEGTDAGVAGAGAAPGSITATINGRPVQLSASVARLVVSGFFAVHYGMFTLVHGIFTFLLAHRSGTSGSVRSFALVFLVLVLSHGLSTGIHWFARGERYNRGLAATMKEPYGRIVVLHLAVLGSSFLLLGSSSHRGTSGGSAAVDAGLLTPTPSVLPGVLLIALKTALDAGFHLRAHRKAEPAVPATAPAVAPTPAG
jgi:hypothetical protein